MHSRLMMGLVLVLGGCATPAAHGPTIRDSMPRPPTGLVEQAATFASQQHSDRLAALTSLLAQLGLEYRIESFDNPRQDRNPRATGHNVTVDLPATGAGSADARTIIVGAHYDAMRLPDGRYVDGMVDNAAGSVVLVHVAHELSTQPRRHPLRIVFFDLEESGLLGSAEFVQGLEPANVLAMINLDVIGYGDTVLYGPATDDGNQHLRETMRGVCAPHRFDCMAFPHYPPSDDRSFSKAGIPSLSLAVLPAAEAHQLWLMLNGGEHSGLREGFKPQVLQTIHTPDDTVERLDPVGMLLGRDAVLALLRALDRELE